MTPVRWKDAQTSVQNHLKSGGNRCDVSDTMYMSHTLSPAQEGLCRRPARLGTQIQTPAQWCIKPPWSRGANHVRPRVKRVFLNIH